MVFEEFKEYIEKIKDTEKFKKLDEFVHMTSIDKTKDFYENINHYLSLFCSRSDCDKPFQPDYDYCVKFLESYLNGIPVNIERNEEGFLDFTKVLYLSQPLFLSKHAGNFLDRYLTLTDGSIYISKLPINYRGNSGISSGKCIFCPLIGSKLAQQLDVETADIQLAEFRKGNRVISRNFLKPNEEIISFLDKEENVKISSVLEAIERELSLRKFSKTDIDKIKFDYLKQETVAKIIKLRDQSTDNTPIIVGIDENGKRTVRLAPMFDLDYSFHIGDKTPNLLMRRCDNGEADIGSFIKQYKDYPGFKEFIIKGINSIDFKKVIEENLSAFDKNKFDEFEKVVSTNIQIAKDTISSEYPEREER